jgi:aromatic-L-amino-acid decarboxylase
VIDYRDWQIPLGRRFRALKLWFVIRWYGAAGLRRHIRRHVALAREFADRMSGDRRFEIVAPVRLGLVCFRLRAGDEAGRRLLDQLNASGALLLTHTRLDDRFVLRLAVGGTLTERRHVEAAWKQIAETAERGAGSG